MLVVVGTIFLASDLCFRSRLRSGDPFLGPLIVNGNSYCPPFPLPRSCDPLCFLLLSTGPHMCWNPSYLSKALPLIAHLPPDTAPFSAPLSIQLLKELLILVSFTPVPFHPYHSTEIILLSIISGLVATISRAQPSSYLTHQQR